MCIRDSTGLDIGVNSGKNGFNISWTAPANMGMMSIERYEMNFVLSRRNNRIVNEGIYNVGSGTSFSTTNYLDTSTNPPSRLSLQPGDSITARLRTVNDGGCMSGWTAFAREVIPARTLGEPIVIQDFEYDADSATLTAIVDEPTETGGGRITGLNVEFPNAGAVKDRIESAVSISKSDSRYTISINVSRIPANTYNAKVSFSSSVGNGTSIIMSAERPYESPGAVQNLTIQRIGFLLLDIELDWESPSNWGGSSTLTYDIERTQPGFPWVGVGGSPVSSNTFIHRKIPPILGRLYRVRAVPDNENVDPGPWTEIDSPA